MGSDGLLGKVQWDRYMYLYRYMYTLYYEMNTFFLWQSTFRFKNGNGKKNGAKGGRE